MLTALILWYITSNKVSYVLAFPINQQLCTCLPVLLLNYPNISCQYTLLLTIKIYYIIMAK